MESSNEFIIQRFLQESDEELRIKFAAKLNHLLERIDTPVEAIIHQFKVISSKRLEVFNSPPLIALLLTYIKLGCASKSPAIVRSNILLLFIDIIYKVHAGSKQWPIELIELYLEDAVSSRKWVDAKETQEFVVNLTSWASPVSAGCTSSGLESVEAIAMGRYSHIREQVTALVVNFLCSKSGVGGESTTKSVNSSSSAVAAAGAAINSGAVPAKLGNLVKTITIFCGIPKVRILFGTSFLQKLLENPALVDDVKKLTLKLSSYFEVKPETGKFMDSDMAILDGMVAMKHRLKSASHIEWHRTVLSSAGCKSLNVGSRILKLLLIDDTERSDKVDRVDKTTSRMESVKLICYLIPTFQSANWDTKCRIRATQSLYSSISSIFDDIDEQYSLCVESGSKGCTALGYAIGQLCIDIAFRPKYSHWTSQQLKYVFESICKILKQLSCKPTDIILLIRSMYLGFASRPDLNEVAANRVLEDVIYLMVDTVMYCQLLIANEYCLKDNDTTRQPGSISRMPSLSLSGAHKPTTATLSTASLSLKDRSRPLLGGLPSLGTGSGLSTASLSSSKRAEDISKTTMTTSTANSKASAISDNNATNSPINPKTHALLCIRAVQASSLIWINEVLTPSSHKHKLSWPYLIKKPTVGAIASSTAANVSTNSNSNVIVDFWYDIISQVMSLQVNALQRFMNDFEKKSLIILKDMSIFAASQASCFIKIATALCDSVSTAMTLLGLLESCIQRAYRTELTDSSTGLLVRDAQIVEELTEFSKLRLIAPDGSSGRPTQMLVASDFDRIQKTRTMVKQESTNSSISTSDCSISSNTNNIAATVDIPDISHITIYWKVCEIAYFLACASPAVIGKHLWFHHQDVRELMLMSICGRFAASQHQSDSNALTVVRSAAKDKLKWKTDIDRIIARSNNTNNNPISSNAVCLRVNDSAWILIAQRKVAIAITATSKTEIAPAIQDLQYRLWGYLFGPTPDISSFVDNKKRKFDRNKGDSFGKRQKSFESFGGDFQSIMEEREQLVQKKEKERDARAMRALMRSRRAGESTSVGMDTGTSVESSAAVAESKSNHGNTDDQGQRQRIGEGEEDSDGENVEMQVDEAGNRNRPTEDALNISNASLDDPEHQRRGREVEMASCAIDATDDTGTATTASMALEEDNCSQSISTETAVAAVAATQSSEESYNDNNSADTSAAAVVLPVHCFVPELDYRFAEPYQSQFGHIASFEDIIPTYSTNFSRSPPQETLLNVKSLDTKFKFGARLRSCNTPDFIRSSLTDSFEDSSSATAVAATPSASSGANNGSSVTRSAVESSFHWLSQAILVDVNSMLVRIPVVASAYLCQIVAAKLVELSCEQSSVHIGSAFSLPSDVAIDRETDSESESNVTMSIMKEYISNLRIERMRAVQTDNWEQISRLLDLLIPLTVHILKELKLIKSQASSLSIRSINSFDILRLLITEISSEFSINRISNRFFLSLLDECLVAVEKMNINSENESFADLNSKLINYFKSNFSGCLSENLWNENSENIDNNSNRTENQLHQKKSSFCSFLLRVWTANEYQTHKRELFELLSANITLAIRRETECYVIVQFYQLTHTLSLSAVSAVDLTKEFELLRLQLLIDMFLTKTNLEEITFRRITRNGINSSVESLVNNICRNHFFQYDLIAFRQREQQQFAAASKYVISIAIPTNCTPTTTAMTSSAVAIATATATAAVIEKPEIERLSYCLIRPSLSSSLSTTTVTTINNSENISDFLMNINVVQFLLMSDIATAMERRMCEMDCSTASDDIDSLAAVSAIILNYIGKKSDFPINLFDRYLRCLRHSQNEKAITTHLINFNSQWLIALLRQSALYSCSSVFLSVVLNHLLESPQQRVGVSELVSSMTASSTSSRKEGECLYKMLLAEKRKVLTSSSPNRGQLLVALTALYSSDGNSDSWDSNSSSSSSRVAATAAATGGRLATRHSRAKDSLSQAATADGVGVMTSEITIAAAETTQDIGTKQDSNKTLRLAAAAIAHRIGQRNSEQTIAFIHDRLPDILLELSIAHSVPISSGHTSDSTNTLVLSVDAVRQFLGYLLHELLALLSYDCMLFSSTSSSSSLCSESCSPLSVASAVTEGRTVSSELCSIRSIFSSLLAVLAPSLAPATPATTNRHSSIAMWSRAVYCSLFANEQQLIEQESQTLGTVAEDIKSCSHRCYSRSAFLSVFQLWSSVLATIHSKSDFHRQIEQLMQILSIIDFSSKQYNCSGNNSNGHNRRVVARNNNNKHRQGSVSSANSTTNSSVASSCAADAFTSDRDSYYPLMDVLPLVRATQLLRLFAELMATYSSISQSVSVEGATSYRNDLSKLLPVFVGKWNDIAHMLEDVRSTKQSLELLNAIFQDLISYLTATLQIVRKDKLFAIEWTRVVLQTDFLSASADRLATLSISGPTIVTHFLPLVLTQCYISHPEAVGNLFSSSDQLSLSMQLLLLASQEMLLRLRNCVTSSIGSEKDPFIQFLPRDIMAASHEINLHSDRYSTNMQFISCSKLDFGFDGVNTTSSSSSNCGGSSITACDVNSYCPLDAAMAACLSMLALHSTIEGPTKSFDSTWLELLRGHYEPTNKPNDPFVLPHNINVHHDAMLKASKFLQLVACKHPILFIRMLPAVIRELKLSARLMQSVAFSSLQAQHNRILFSAPRSALLSSERMRTISNNNSSGGSSSSTSNASSGDAAVVKVSFSSPSTVATLNEPLWLTIALCLSYLPKSFRHYSSSNCGLHDALDLIWTVFNRRQVMAKTLYVNIPQPQLDFDIQTLLKGIIPPFEV